MVGAERKADVEAGQVERHQVGQRLGLDGVGTPRPAGARDRRAGDGGRLHHADVDVGRAARGVPLPEDDAARRVRQFDAEQARHDGARRRLRADRGRRRTIGRAARHRPVCGRPRSFGERVAEQLAAHEADDLLAAPDVVAQELAGRLQLGAAAAHRVAQVQAPVAQRRKGQVRSPRPLERPFDLG